MVELPWRFSLSLASLLAVWQTRWGWGFPGVFLAVKAAS